MGSTCSKTVIDVIPDKDVMLEIVETISQFEDLLKRDERMTKKQKQEMKRVAVVTKEMKKLVKLQAE